MRFPRCFVDADPQGEQGQNQEVGSDEAQGF